MRQRTKAMTGVLVIVLMLFGCSSSFNSGSKVVQSGPGSVLGPAQEGIDNRRTVTFNVIGKGLEPENAVTKGEAILMAERAAIADGYRQFVEKIKGVYVDAYMKAGYRTVNEDMIKTHTQSWLRGVNVMEVRQVKHGITEAHMQLRINFTKKGMVWWPTGLVEGVVFSS